MDTPVLTVLLRLDTGYNLEREREDCVQSTQIDEDDDNKRVCQLVCHMKHKKKQFYVQIYRQKFLRLAKTMFTVSRVLFRV